MIVTRHTKLLLLSALVLMLQACASYDPHTYGTIRPDEYYAQNDEYRSAFEQATPDVSAGFASAEQYPWWSMDYYYMGSHLYRPGYWTSPRYTPGFSLGYRAGFWPYYSFYSPFYYPYSTYAWYDPWTGYPRYGIGTNLFWREYSAWASQNNIPSVTRQDRYGRSVYSSREQRTSLYQNYRNNSAFYDVRDRSGVRSSDTPGIAVTSGTRSGSTQVRRRADTKVWQSRTGATSVTRSPGISQPSSRSISRPSNSTARPPSIPRSQPSTNARTSSTVKKHKN